MFCVQSLPICRTNVDTDIYIHCHNVLENFVVTAKCYNYSKLKIFNTPRGQFCFNIMQFNNTVFQMFVFFGIPQCRHETYITFTPAICSLAFSISLSMEFLFKDVVNVILTLMLLIYWTICTDIHCFFHSWKVHLCCPHNFCTNVQFFTQFRSIWFQPIIIISVNLSLTLLWFIWYYVYV